MDLLALSGVSQLATLACLCASVHVYRNGTLNSQALVQLLGTLATGLIPFVLGTLWLKLVTRTVPEPYLDEVFHIPQAQVYCEGRYRDWDDKITTPPGLYLLSIWLIQGWPCTTESLRMVNVGIVSCIAIVSAICFTLHRRGHATSPSLNVLWAGTNVALFPVIFFFSGLYYTDGASTLVVLLAYWAHLVRAGQAKPSIVSGLITVMLGLSSLFMRQTNIFWVVVYMGGLEAVNAVKSLRPESADWPRGIALGEQVKFYAWRYSVGDIHDPSLDMATPIVDVALCAISLLIAGVCNVLPVLRRIWPHVTVLAAFAGFVVWNGGVVLGDKSNHVATLHLAQMLYIWPLFVFFSAPLFILPAVQLARHTWIKISMAKDIPDPVSTRHNMQAKETNKPQPSTQTLITTFAKSNLLQAAIVLVTSLAVALATVHLSTIIHPFTLADNRHYMFYVFRYSILRAWWVRFALGPVYVACASLCWLALQGRWHKPRPPPSATEERLWICSPWSDADLSAVSNVESSASLTTAAAAPSTSTVLIFLIATALSLMTAPLVEPRYFILPWVFWRLHVPAWPLPLPASTTVGAASADSTPPSTASGSGGNIIPVNGSGSNSGSLSSSGNTMWWHVDVQIVLETLWFGLINAATMYVFLTRPFYWKALDGSLADEGRVQRFMW
ncbi:alpha-1,2-glucosyltransferase [Microdochium nivale]|nr:alpha-1,2-glucosyltransferase [Microdochium nivale]